MSGSDSEISVQKSATHVLSFWSAKDLSWVSSSSSMARRPVELEIAMGTGAMTAAAAIFCVCGYVEHELGGERAKK